MTLEEIDAVGLIREAYRIDGITDAECRSIFVDWALRLPSELNAQEAITALLKTYEAGQEAHPMTLVLKEGLTKSERPKRRGGRAARVT